MQSFKKFVSDFTLKRLFWLVLGTAILSFGIHNIHQRAAITEGGVIGLVLLLNHWLGIPASIASPLLDFICYALAFKFLALLGGVFVGIGVGIIVRQGGSSGGDDALALVIHQLTGWKLARSYLFTDLVVLGASLSYIPARRIAFSLVTVTVSSLLIDWVQGLGRDEKIHGNDAAKEVE